MKKPLKDILINSSLFLSSCLFCFVCAEVFFRLFLPQDLISPMAARLDEEIIYTLTPDFESRLKGTSPRMFLLKTNSLGLREREPGPKTGRRILLLGDSMSMAEGAEYDEIYLKKLGGLIEKSGYGPVETVNAAIRGYGNDQELILMRRVAPVYSPDIIILAFFTGNDMEDNWDGQLFRLEDGGVVQQPATPGSSRKYRYYRTQSRIQGIPGYAFFMAHSHAANWARVSFARLLQKKVYKPAGPKAAAVPLKDRPAYRLTEGVLLQWKKEVLALGARPYLMVIPKREDVRKMRGGAPSGKERLDLAIEGFCRREKIPFLNLTHAMASMPEGFEKLWLNCGHFSPRGHEWVAEALYSDLSARPLLRKK